MVIPGKWWLHHLHATFWCHLFVPQNSGSWNVSVNRFQSNKSIDRQNLQKKLRDQLEFCYVDKQSKKEDSKTRFLAGCNWANTFLGKLHRNIRRSHQAVIIEVKGLEIFNDLLLSNGIMEKGRKRRWVQNFGWSVVTRRGNLHEIAGGGRRLPKGFSSIKNILKWTTSVTETKRKCLSCE